MNVAVPERCSTTSDARSLNAARAAFFLGGFGLSAWAPLVPYVQSRLHLTSGELGVFLLCIGIGSLISMPLAGPLTSRVGCRVVLCAADVIFCLSLPLLSVCTGRVELALALFAFGGAIGANGVAMNVQASLVERACARPVMSGILALFSVGGILGSGGMTLLLSLQITPIQASLAADAVIAVVLLGFAHRFLSHGGESGPAFAVPHGSIVLLGFIACMIYLVEGMMLDWSAVILTKIQHIPVSLAGAGYMTFACLMVVGRLLGDRMVKKFGQLAILRGGLLTAAIGLAIMVGFRSSITAFAGLALVGAGASNVVPILFRLAGSNRAMPTSTAIAAVATLGYVGVLVGPALIGFLASAVGLTTAVLIIALATFSTIALVRSIRDGA
ncbi:MFS transporter, partial [Xenorhabdus sp. IM139775]|uniref:MFS transporter n=1 Tax=Xenorhabdus sp. IM139775 TaxID=3025876 RepID=UPI002358B265